MNTRRWRLRRLVVSGACAASLVLAAADVSQADEPLTILFYGNSFTLGSGSSEATSYGGVPGIVALLAEDAGHAAPNVENAAASGQNLSWHLANNLAVIDTPLDFTPEPGFQWDHVVIQGYSTGPTHLGDLNQFRSDVVDLYGVVRSHSPGSGAVLYETWARAPGHSVYTGADPSFPGGPAQMQQELRDGYGQAQEDLGVTWPAALADVAPVGDAWEDTGWNDLHSGDLYHANSRGTYLAALVIYGTIYEESVVGRSNVLPSITAPEAAELQAYAEGVIPRPCGFTGDDCNSNCVPDDREEDCNGNGIPDDCDLAAETSEDCDVNGIPDECEAWSRVVWSDDFDADTSAMWSVVTGDSGDLAAFSFDYGTVGIPAAPHTVGGTTRGLRLEANTAAGPADASGVCVYPVGPTFSGDYTLTWDMYLSWDSPGSTEHACAGINHSGTQLNGSAEVSDDTDGVFFAVSGDGGVAAGDYPIEDSIKDYNSYFGSPGAAPTRNLVPHWDNGQPVLADHFPMVGGDPIGDSTAGSPGRQWVAGEIAQQDGVVTCKLDGRIMASQANTSGFDSGTVMLGLFDHFAAQNTTGNAFVIFDNVRVSTATDERGRLVGCLTGPCETGLCDPALYSGLCCAADADTDGDVDLVDFADLQRTYSPPPPPIHFDPVQLAFELEEGATDQQSVLAYVDVPTAPTVDLVAVDDATQAAPTWLSVPASVAVDVPFAVEVNAAGLPTGDYSATVTGSAADYAAGTFEVALRVTVAGSDPTILIDFGDSSTQTLDAPRHWNNVYAGSMTGNHSLNTVAGVDSGVVLTVHPLERFNGANLNGTTSPAPGSDLEALGYPTTALQDSLFGNDVTFSGGIFETAELMLSGLDPAATYDLTFSASRMGVADVRTADYEVTGLTTVAATLDAANNQAEIARVLGMAPNAENRITITVHKAASNTNSYGFYYLGALQVDKIGP